jgi:probable HAF family extracellular repeat protein
MRRMLLLVGAVVVVIVSTVAVSGATSAGSVQARWVIRDLGTIGGPESEAVAINERGQVVGWADTKTKRKVGVSAYSVSHAFLWGSARMTDLGKSGIATAVNGRGEVVIDGAGVVLWQDGKTVDLGAPRDSTAYGFNARGQVVVGTWRARDSRQRGFVAERGRLRDLGTLGGPSTYFLVASTGGFRPRADAQPRFINGRGQVIGLSDTSGDFSPSGFVWQDGVMRDLGDLDPLAINDAGVIAANGAWSRGAVLWEKGKTRDLGEMLWAGALNEKQVVVGYCKGTAPPRKAAPAVPCLWQAGKVHRLGLLPGDDRGKAWAVNERDQVIGFTLNRGRIAASTGSCGRTGRSPRFRLWEACRACPSRSTTTIRSSAGPPPRTASHTPSSGHSAAADRSPPSCGRCGTAPDPVACPNRVPNCRDLSELRAPHSTSERLRTAGLSRLTGLRIHARRFDSSRGHLSFLLDRWGLGRITAGGGGARVSRRRPDEVQVGWAQDPVG